MSWAAQPVSEQLRQGHLALIQEAPITLPLLHQSKVRQGGGWSPFQPVPPEVLGPFVMRVHIAGSTRLVRGRPEDIAVQVRNPDWGVALPADCNLPADADNPERHRYELAHPVYGRMRLVHLRTLQYAGLVYGYQADLEILQPQL